MYENVYNWYNECIIIYDEDNHTENLFVKQQP